ncbi:MAG: hypothetical protein ACE5DI_00845 [Candidatus Micrarchaeia archaeon]
MRGRKRLNKQPPLRDKIKVVVEPGGHVLLRPAYKLSGEGSSKLVATYSNDLVKARVLEKPPNFYVFKRGNRTIAVFGDDHSSMRVRSKKSWLGLLKYASKKSKNEINLIGSESEVKRLRKMGFSVEEIDDKPWIKNPHKVRLPKINSSKMERPPAPVIPTNLFALDPHPTCESELEGIGRHATMTNSLLKHSVKKPVLGVVGALHVFELARILEEAGFERVFSKRITNGFLSHSDKAKLSSQRNVDSIFKDAGYLR